MPVKALINSTEAATLHELFCRRVTHSPDAPAYRWFDRQLAQWHCIAWSAMAARVARWQQALAGEGLAPGERVALSVRNGIDWICFDQAALSLGLVTVPLYTDDRPDNVAYILADCGARLLLVQDRLRWQRLAPALTETPALRRVVILDGAPGDEEDPRVRMVSAWLPQQAPPMPAHPAQPHELATLVYTSGTTGRSKGVMLSHSNILRVVEAGLASVDIYADDQFLSFLPLSHTFERTVGYYLPMMAGACVAFARSVPQLGEDLNAVRPTVMIAVPRIFERVYGRITQQLAAAPPWRRRLFEAAVDIGWRRFEHSQGRVPWHPGILLWPLLRRLVARPVLARLGGRLRLVVSGGAALSPAIARTFIGLGLPLLQGYGLTENSPQVCVNRLHDNDPASVGAALPGIEVCIGEESELLVRGPGVMQGYWNNPAATAAVIRDGWLHTGDQARIENGRIHITGRIKDVLVLSNGEKVSPSDLELAIALDPLFEQVMLVGEGHAFLGAITVLNPELWNALACELGVDPQAAASLEDRHVQHALLQRIAAQLHAFPAWAKVRRVHPTLEPWSVENDLLTPTLKVKRARVLARFQNAVAAFYQSEVTSLKNVV